MSGFYPVDFKKQIIANLFFYTGISRLALVAISLWPKIRVVNYHSTPSCFAEQFEKQLQFYCRHFHPCTRNELSEFVIEKKWPFRKPGIILTFDDGLRDNFLVAAPLLEKYGFQGWFFVPSEFIDCPPTQQQEFATSCLIRKYSSYPDGRIAISPEELRILSSRHVVGCHAASHRRLIAGLADEILNREIIEPQKKISMILGVKVDSFCWAGGEESSYSSRAAEIIRDCGFQFAFMTNNSPITFRTNQLQIQRSNVEVSWPISVVQFQLSGFLDLLYWPKRMRVNRLTLVETKTDKQKRKKWL